MTLNSQAMMFLAATAQDIKTHKYHQAVPSPCMSVCKMDEASGWCQGCLRTIDEIRAWGNADETFKRRIWTLIEARLVPSQAAAADDLFDATP
jgi:predicted Fe-S protein YdhL (DUF1289 family)